MRRVNAQDVPHHPLLLRSRHGRAPQHPQGEVSSSACTWHPPRVLTQPQLQRHLVMPGAQTPLRSQSITCAPKLSLRSLCRCRGLGCLRCRRQYSHSGHAARRRPQVRSLPHCALTQRAAPPAHAVQGAAEHDQQAQSRACPKHASAIAPIGCFHLDVQWP